MQRPTSAEIFADKSISFHHLDEQSSILRCTGWSSHETLTLCTRHINTTEQVTLSRVTGANHSIAIFEVLKNFNINKADNIITYCTSSAQLLHHSHIYLDTWIKSTKQNHSGPPSAEHSFSIWSTFKTLDFIPHVLFIQNLKFKSFEDPEKWCN